MVEKFPLVIWQGTDEYKKEMEEAKGRFRGICERLERRCFRCSYIGDLRADNHGYPEIWINDGSPFNEVKDSGEAMVLSLKHGATGWWDLDELEEFVEGKGVIIEKAMWEWGFRRHKKYQDRWTRIKKNDGVKNPHNIRWDKKFKYSYAELTDEEAKRLDGLRVMSNELTELGKSYSISVGSRGLIHILLDVNPFVGTSAQTLYLLDEQISHRGHLAREQNGFYIDARNIKINDEAWIHIKAVRQDDSYAECVWPAKTSSGTTLYELASGLNSIARKAS